MPRLLTNPELLDRQREAKERLDRAVKHCDNVADSPVELARACEGLRHAKACFEEWEVQ